MLLWTLERLLLLLEQLQNGTEEDNAIHSLLQKNAFILEAEIVVPDKLLAYLVNPVEEKNVDFIVNSFSNTLTKLKENEILEPLITPKLKSATVSNFPFANSSYPGKPIISRSDQYFHSNNATFNKF